MINERRLRPIINKMAAKLCLAHGRYRWQYLRAAALERIELGWNDKDEYVHNYRCYLRMARAAVKLMEEVK